MNDDKWMQRAIWLSGQAAATGSSPFGAVVVVGEAYFDGQNATENATALDHAETLAIRSALRRQGTPTLGTDSTLYTSCAPCPMCLASAFYGGIRRVVYGLRIADVIPLGSGDRPTEPEELEAFVGFGFEIIGGIRRDEALRVVADVYRERGHL